jgi:cytochrome P450 PksS
LFTDPPDHMRLRALVSKAFTPRAVERLRDRIQSVCDELLDSAAPEGRLELVQGFALRLPLTIIADMLGIPAAERRRFNAWTKRVLEGTGLTLAGLALGMPALWQSERYLRELIARRRVDPQEDMVTALIQAEEAGDKLSEDEVMGMIGILLLAGFETTMGLIASGTLALLQHPEQRRRFVLEPSLADSAVEELLRYTSPLEMGAFRIAREDVAIGSVTIPKGDLVLAVLSSANRDEARFKGPDILDLAREPNRHLAFGAGGHFCLGASLARMEGRIALTSLFRRFPDLRLAEPVETLPWRRSMPVRCPARVPLTL